MDLSTGQILPHRLASGQVSLEDLANNRAPMQVALVIDCSGSMAEDGKTLNMSGKGPSPMGGGSADYRTVEVDVDDDTRHFDMYVQPAGMDEIHMFHYVYTRA